MCHLPDSSIKQYLALLMIFLIFKQLVKQDYLIICDFSNVELHSELHIALDLILRLLSLLTVGNAEICI